MSYTVLVPARMASTRLPGKPLADIHGVAMVVRVARRASRSAASAVVVAADDVRIVERCTADGVRALLTRADHATGSDRLAEACDLLGLNDDDCIVNVQGDEPLIDPGTIDACAALLRGRPDVALSTAAHAIARVEDYWSVDVVKVVLDRRGDALLFSRAPIPHRRASAGAASGQSAGDDTADAALPDPAPLRHIGIYGYRVGALRRFAKMPMAPIERTESLEQLRALWNGDRIAVHVSPTSAAPGVDTPADLERMRLLCARDDASGA